MKSKARKMLFAISTVLMIAVISPSVKSAHYVFSQSAFSNGGLVTGSFDAVDKFRREYDMNSSSYIGISEPDGYINWCSGSRCTNQRYNDEVSNFSIHFSGNPFFESLNLVPNTHLDYFYFDINNLIVEELAKPIEAIGISGRIAKKENNLSIVIKLKLLKNQ